MIRIYNKTVVVRFLIMWVLLTCAVEAEPLKVAVRAHQGIEKAEQRWLPTLRALERSIKDQEFHLVPILSLTELVKRAGQAEFDFVLTNPSSFVEIQQTHGAKALVTLINNRANTAQNQFGSVIFTHASRTDILSLHDLEDRTLMVVAKKAFGGWQVAWLEMLEQGFDPYQKLKKISFTSGETQPEVVQAVLEKTVDAGVVRTDLLERLEKSGQIDLRYLRIINNKDINEFPFFLSTKLYPEWAFAALSHISPELSSRLVVALKSIKKGSDAARQGRYMGWKSPDNYHEVKRLMQRLKVGPYAK